MRRGEWAKKSFNGRTLNGKTLGIIGFGSVGQALSALTHPPCVCSSYDILRIPAGLDVRLWGWKHVAHENRGVLALLDDLFFASTLAVTYGCQGCPRRLRGVTKMNLCT